METTRISGIETPVSRIGLGTWAIGGWMWGGLTHPFRCLSRSAIAIMLALAAAASPAKAEAPNTGAGASPRGSGVCSRTGGEVTLSPPHGSGAEKSA